MSIESVMPSHHLILCRPLLLLPSIFPSIRVFSNELALHLRWPKYRSFSFSISPSNEDSGLISFRIYWFDLLASQGTFKGLLWHHSSKASTLWRSAFFVVQLSHPYMTTGKTIALLYRHLYIALIFITIYIYNDDTDLYHIKSCWANSGRQWRTEEPGMLQSTGSQRVRHNLVTEQQQKSC